MLVDCWRLVEKHGRKPTIKGTMRMAREIGAHFNEHEARALLRPFAQKSTPLAPRSNPVRTPQNEHVYPVATPLAPISKRGTHARSKGTPSSESLFPNGALLAPSETVAEAEWVTSLRAQYAALSERQVITLGTSARILFARWWTLEFGYVRSDEAKNRRRSDSALSSFANLIEVLRRNGVPFSVTDLEKLARRYHADVKGGKPWYTPCDVKALLVVEAVR